MYIFNTCHPKAQLVRGYPPVVPTAECRLCGEKTRLTPIEALTNQAELNSGNYVCPLCRRLMAEAEGTVPHSLDLSSLFPMDEAVPFSTLTMNEMEDQCDDSYEEKSDSDEAADNEHEGAGSMCPPSDEGPDAEECGDDELSLEADLWLQVKQHGFLQDTESVQNLIISPGLHIVFSSSARYDKTVTRTKRQKGGSIMYYSSGNYEAFARPEKPEGVEHKSAYIIGTGLAALSAACYLVRDAQMPGKRIHIFEKDPIPGGACDGYEYPGVGYVMRGGREMDNHFEVMWDLFRSIPSIETEGVSVLDEYYWLNKKDPNFSLCRATENRGQDAHTDGKFAISDKGAMEIMHLFFTPDEELYNKKITDFFDDEVLNSNFWLYWRTMFAFENWHSALEMKLYIKRFIHHIGGLPDFKALRFTKYNQYESMILPMVRYLESHDVQFHYNTKVVNVDFDIKADGSKHATAIEVLRNGQQDFIMLTDDDYVFITNGGCVENSTMGSQNMPADFRTEIKEGGGWDMWRRIAAQDPAFGHPGKFCFDPEQTNWMSATVTTLDDRIIPYIERICKRDPFSGGVVTGGIVTVKDSGWLMSWTINRQPQFRNQPKDQCLVWVYGLFTDKPGNYIQKPMRECTGKEICMEWLYHIGVPEKDIPKLAEESANTVPVMMPYITAFFMPREKGDRPDVVPEGAVNFAFLGQFAETKRDTIFTTEYSMRTGMEAVYTLLNVDRGVPEVWGSTYDVRDLLNASVMLRDGRPLTDMKLGMKEKAAVHELFKRIHGTDIEKLLAEYHVIG